jgi:hypothetical protein
MSGLNLVTLFLIVNSLILILLIVTQNDTTKDSANQKSSRTNPLEIIIGIAIIIELLMILIEKKITDF